MRVLWGEIRKLLWWRNLLIAFLLGAIYYWVIVWSLVGLFPNGHPMTEHHHYTQAWHDEFGPTLEPSEVAVIEARLAALVREADAVIAADPTLAANGVTGWRAYTEREELNPETDPIVAELLFQPGGLGWLIQGMGTDLEGYRPVGLDQLTPAQLARAEEINRTGEWRSLQSAELLQFLLDYPPRLAGLAILIVLLIAAPLVTTDRVSRLRRLQLSTPTGRGLLGIQLIATVTVTVSATALLLVVTSLPLLGFGFATFWDTPIQSFTAGVLYPSVTLGQYCWLLAGTVLLAGLLAGFTGFAVSRANRAYPALAISVMAGLAVGLPFSSTLLELPVTYYALAANLLGTPYAQLIVPATLAAVALAVCLVQVHRERTVDIDD